MLLCAKRYFFSKESNFFATVRGAPCLSTTIQKWSPASARGRIQNAKSVTTNYPYHASNDLLTKVKTGTSEVNYGYNTGNRLISLSHNTSSSSSDNVNYSFQYNGFGTRTGIKVGTQNLVTYTYAAHNGDLTKTTYGNGQDRGCS